MKNAFITKAILLLGPTGSGKSPLGNALEKLMNWQHLDFGHCLRQIERGSNNFGLLKDEASFVKDLIQKNALFPDDRLNIAQKIIDNFITKSHNKTVILNGFPRNITQAKLISEHINIIGLISLSCSNNVLKERIQRRKAGIGDDHAARNDDHNEAINKKMAIFSKETKPLIGFFKKKGAKFVSFDINIDENMQKIAEKISKSGFFV